MVLYLTTVVVESVDTGDLKILRAECSTKTELCLQTAGLLKFDYLRFGASLQLHIPSFEEIEYAAMVELVDTRDLKSAGLNPAPNPNCACKQPTF